jgi:AraC-like DNA-binding protein
MINEPIKNLQSVFLPAICFSSAHNIDNSFPHDPNLIGSHIHNCYEIYFNLSGNISFLVNNKIYPVEKGDIIFSRPDDVHVCIVHNKCIHEHFCLWITKECGDKLFPQDLKKNFFHFSKTETETIFELISNINSEDIPEYEKASMILQIVFILSNKASSEPTRTIIPMEFQQVLDYIDCNFFQITCIGDLCRKFSISPSTLGRWFKKYVYLPPTELIKSKKLSFAKSLLDNGATVTDACIQSGFSDCSYFISVFKNKFGVTPLHYKQKKF